MSGYLLLNFILAIACQQVGLQFLTKRLPFFSALHRLLFSGG